MPIREHNAPVCPVQPPPVSELRSTRRRIPQRTAAFSGGGGQKRLALHGGAELEAYKRGSSAVSVSREKYIGGHVRVVSLLLVPVDEWTVPPGGHEAGSTLQVELRLPGQAEACPT